MSYTLQSAIGYSEDIHHASRAGKHISQQILAALTLRDQAVGILFACIDFNFPELLESLYAYLHIPIIGCTTSGELNGNGYFESSACLLVLTGKNLKVGIGVGTALNTDPVNAVHTACARAQSNLGPYPPKLVITFPDTSLKNSSEDLLTLIMQRLPAHTPVIGGIPGDNFHMEQTYQFVYSSVYSNSIPVLMLGGPDIHPTVVTRSGWLPIGRRVQVTRSNRHLVYALNHAPAIDYLESYGVSTTDPHLLSSFPLAVFNSSPISSSKEHFIIRSAFFYDEHTGAIHYNGNIPEGSTVQLARGSRADILSGTQEAIETIVRHREHRPTSTLLCFSCTGRRFQLGLHTAKEAQIIRTHAPLTYTVNGFYTYGEIGAIDSTDAALRSVHFHNATLVLCAL